MSEMDNKNITDLNTQRPPADEIYTGQEYKSSSAKETKEEKQPGIAKDISILVMITLAAGVLLGAAYGVTKAPIAKAQAEAKAKAQKEVMPEADSFSVLYTDDGKEGEMLPDSISEAIVQAGMDTTTVSQIDEALDENGETMGYVVTTSNPEGYGGDVEVMSGITKDDENLTIQGISFLSLSETAGMGMRAKDEEFLNQFKELQVVEDKLVEYVKDGAEESHEIDAISGCTITTSAVTDNVNAALVAIRQSLGAGAENSTKKSDASDTGSEKVSKKSDASDTGSKKSDASDTGSEGTSDQRTVLDTEGEESE